MIYDFGFQILDLNKLSFLFYQSLTTKVTCEIINTRLTGWGLASRREVSDMFGIRDENFEG